MSEGATSPTMPSRRPRRSLFAKYFVTLFVAVVLPLLLGATSETWFGYRDQRVTLSELLRAESRSAANRIQTFVDGIRDQLGWVVQLPWTDGDDERHRIDALRLLRQVPAISSITLIDERAHRMLDRFDLTLLDCFQPEGLLRERIAAKLLPANLQRVFDDAGTAVLESTDHLCATLDAFDPTLGAAMRKSVVKIQFQLDKNRGKAAREALRRETRITENAARLSGLLYPERHLQERLYSFLPFLAWQGPCLIDTLYENTYRACPDHLLMTL